MLPRQILLIVCVACFSINNSLAQSGRAVWVDADPACDQKLNNDVDDCLALAYVLSQPSLRVVGISTTFGNIDGQASYQIAKSLLREYSRHGLHYTQAKLYPGALKSIDKINSKNNAVEALHSALQKQKLTLIALGPLSNIALLLRHYPGDAKLIRRIIVVAGQRDKAQRVFRLSSNSLLHMHDLNFRKDVAAFKIILDAEIPLTLVPFEVSSKILLTPSDLNHWAKSSDLSRWLRRQSEQWLRFWRDGFGVNGFYPFDLVAVAYVVDPNLLQCEPVQLQIIDRRSFFRESRSNLVASASKQSLNNYCYAPQINAKETILAQMKRIGAD